MTCRFHLIKLGEEFPHFAPLAKLLMHSSVPKACERPVMCVALLTLGLVSLNLAHNSGRKNAFAHVARVSKDKTEEDADDEMSRLVPYRPDVMVH